MNLTRKDFLKAAATALAAIPLRAVANSAAPAPKANFIPAGDPRRWWFDARFGMFIHWGLYSIKGWHEQDQWRRKIPRAEYGKLREQWNPVKFDPDAWIDLAQAAGMKYLCFTTKHHDGFCLWDTKLTEFNTMNSPYGKDILKQLADACHRRKFPLCLYYSIADWHQPNYPNQGRHHELPPQPGDSPDWNLYLDFLKAQVRELCSNYGEIHGFWWDMNVPEHVDPSINAMIRELQPKAMINNRGFDPGDFGTPERDWDSATTSKSRFGAPVEACQSVGYQSWGYRADEDYYSDAHLIRGIHNMLAKGANYLLNVGPQADGVIPETVSATLRRIGTWIESIRESFDGAEPVHLGLADKSIALTRRGNSLYIHVLPDPETSSIFLHPLVTLPQRATLLNNGVELNADIAALPRWHDQQPPAALRIRPVPINGPPPYGRVLRLDFETFPAATRGAAKDETR